MGVVCAVILGPLVSAELRLAAYRSVGVGLALYIVVILYPSFFDFGDGEIEILQR